MSNNLSTANSGQEQGVGAPDEIIAIRRSDSVGAMVAELLDFFDDPRLDGLSLSEAQASWIVGGGLKRAVLVSSLPTRCQLLTSTADWPLEIVRGPFVDRSPLLQKFLPYPS